MLVVDLCLSLVYGMFFVCTYGIVSSLFYLLVCFFGFCISFLEVTFLVLEICNPFASPSFTGP